MILKAKRAGTDCGMYVPVAEGQHTELACLYNMYSHSERPMNTTRLQSADARCVGCCVSQDSAVNDSHRRNAALRIVAALASAHAHLVDPVRVEHTKASDLAADTLLSHGAQVALGLELSDTLAGGLSVHNTLSQKRKMQDHDGSEDVSPVLV